MTRRLRLLILILIMELALGLTLISRYFLNQTQLGDGDQTDGASYKILQKFSFHTPQDLKQWQEKVFNKKTRYELLKENDQAFLKASSDNASSGLYMTVRYDVVPELMLAWDWKAGLFPKKNNPTELANRKQDDFAARIYVIFPGSTFLNTHVIEYIWDESLPIGTIASSPFSGRVKLFVIRTGAPNATPDGWIKEERNIYDDYLKLFGREPERPIGAIALMSDSDNTKTQSESFFRNIEFKIQRQA